MTQALVAVAGNQNTGKTTLFNALTDSRAKVGNYPGVTVSRRTARTTLEQAGEVEILDVPGTYSLLARTGEEEIAIEALLGLRNNPNPVAAIICVDANQLLRGLYLLLQVQEAGLPVVVALTMMDEAGDAAPDTAALARVLNCPVVGVNAPKRQGIRELKRAVDAVVAKGSVEPLWRWTPSAELTKAMDELYSEFPEGWPVSDAMALWALQCISPDDELLGIPDPLRTAVLNATVDGDAVDDEVVGARYGWLDQHVAPIITKQPDRSRTDKIDRVLIHHVAGFGIFLGVMFVVFQALFVWADPAITVIEALFGWLGDGLTAVLPVGSIVTDFLVDGVVAGVGSVVVFLPQILLLFFFIGLMEDSGYMARVAHLMDGIMKSMNLNGRAFVPMLSGFACAIPAVMATRTMERKRDRLLTMMVVPLMTCSARLPVYTLVIAALFPAGMVLGIFPAQGLLMVAMYLFSTLIALAAAWVMSKTMPVFKAGRLPMVIELPPYRMPRIKDVLRMMWERTSNFLEEAGKIILACTILLWFLLAFPRNLHNPSQDYEALMDDASAGRVAQLQQEQKGELLRHSYGGRLGRALEPFIEPLGFDWKIGVGLIGAFAAREVFVSTMGVVYSIGEDVDEGSHTLRERMRAEVREDGRPVYSPLVGLSLMVFFALACQCMSTIAVVRRETGGWKWPGFLFAYMTVLAWIASFVVYQGGRMLSFT